MRTTFSGYTRRDWIIACAVVLALFILACMQLTRGIGNWGDDFAAYISEGIAISTGTLEEQAVRNYTLHLSQLPEEASAEGLVYVWGFPLLLALVHRVVGFDIVTFSSVIWYKVPSLIALALTAGVLYLYYRRRFSQSLALFLAVILCFRQTFIRSMEHLNVDILFLFVFQLSLLLADCYLDVCLVPKRRTLCLAAALGAAMWYTCVTRLNGMTVLFVVAASHVIRLIPERRELTLRRGLLQLLPYLTFGALWYGAHQFLPEATSNLSDVGKATPEVVMGNIQYYLNLMKEFCNELIGGVPLPLWPLMLLLTALGLYREALSRENIPMTGLLAGSFLVLLLLPYTQGLRYIFNLLPILLMFAARGGLYAWEWLRKKGWGNQGDKLLRGLALAVLVLTVAGQLKSGVSNLARDRAPVESDVYSQDAVEMYRYIQENIPEDQVVAFWKSRALYLNTGRMSFRLGYNGHVLEDADYYLFDIFMHESDDWETVTKKQESLRQVWTNDTFLLYEVVK